MEDEAKNGSIWVLLYLLIFQLFQILVEKNMNLYKRQWNGRLNNKFAEMGRGSLSLSLSLSLTLSHWVCVPEAASCETKRLEGRGGVVVAEASQITRTRYICHSLRHLWPDLGRLVSPAGLEQDVLISIWPNGWSRRQQRLPSQLKPTHNKNPSRQPS